MILNRQIRAGVLSTVIVVSVLMLLIVLGILSLWDMDFLLFSRAHYLRTQRDYTESALTIYCNDPDIINRLEADSTLLLFDSVPSSRVKITVKPWGLYEIASIESKDGKVRRSSFCGLRELTDKNCVLWYKNNNRAITIAGKSHIEGKISVPHNGIIYGAMGSIFFSGNHIDPNNIGKSDDAMESPAAATGYIDHLFGLVSDEGLYSDSITITFTNRDPQIINVQDKNIDSCYLSGNIILRGDNIKIGALSVLNDIIIVANRIEVGDGFVGSCQLFAKVSVFIGENVRLEYPSGVYSQRYAEIKDGSEVNGFFIVDYPGEIDNMKANCHKSRLSKVRGLFYCRGLAQVQGIVSGMTYLDRSVFYSPEGYYQDIIYDLTLLQNGQTAYPLWFDDRTKRKAVKWLH